DPFSSYDEHKRNYIYDFLFGKKGLLKGRTVVYLTHDIEPVFDLIYLKIPTGFDKCYSLENLSGNIVSTEVNKRDIKKYRDYLVETINKSNNEIIKLVYIR